jgi:hypothetical protein
MPPPPVLALLSFIGFLVYVVIGAAVTAPIVRKVSDDYHVAGYIESGADGKIAPGYFFAVMGWPLVLAAVVLVCVIAVPLFLGGKVSRYVARVDLDRKNRLNSSPEEAA